MPVTIDSTTDTPEQVLAATGGAKQKPVDEVEQKESAPADDKSVDETAKDSDALDTDEAESKDEPDDKDDSDEDESKDEDQKPKKKNGFKKRIDKLNQRLSAKDQEIEHWRQEALKSKSPQEKQNEAPERIEIEGDPEPREEDYESITAHTKAQVKWEMRQEEAAKAAKAQAESAKLEYQRTIESHNSRVAEFAKTQPDYTEVVSEFIEDHGDVKFSPALEESIVTSDMGPALLYELAKNPEELIRINSLGWTAAIRAIAKVEARLEKSPSKDAEKKLTKTPAPIAPVGSKGTASIQKDPEKMSFAEYKQWRAQQK